MGVRLNTQPQALNLTNNLGKTMSKVNASLTQLASGRRINRAADDASGMAVADRFATMVAQSNQEIQNLQQGINYAQTADGALGSQADMGMRLRELALQASNGTLTQDQRNALNNEAQQILQQIDETANSTEYNGQNLLKQNTSVDLGVQGGMQVATQASTTTSLGLNGLDLTSQNGAQSAVDTIDAALKGISNNRSSLGAQQNRLTSAIQEREVRVENASAAESAIRDADYANAFMNNTRNTMLSNANMAMLVQSNLVPQQALSLLG